MFANLRLDTLVMPPNRRTSRTQNSQQVSSSAFGGKAGTSCSAKNVVICARWPRRQRHEATAVHQVCGRNDEGHAAIDVNQLIRAVVTDFRGDLEEYRISASVKLQENLPRIVAHKGQLHQVLINLVRNAIEAMQDDKSDHRVPQVSNGRHDHDKIILSIVDSGPGIDPRHAANIFDAFVTTKSHGMGLGLALCRMIIERHSGELSVSPAYPHGSIFRIVLPIFAHDDNEATNVCF